MNNKKRKSILYFIIVFMFLSCFIVQTVNAADSKKNTTSEKSDKDTKEEIKECKDTLKDDETILELYGIQIETDKVSGSSSSNQVKHTITMKTSDKSKNTTVSFVADITTGTLDGSNSTLSKNKTVKILTNDKGNFEVTFTANVDASNPELGLDNKKCKGEIKFTLNSTTVKNTAGYTSHVINDSEVPNKKEDVSDTVLKCNNPTNDVDKLICSARAAKEVTINSKDDYSKYSKFNADKMDFTKDNSFKCDINNFKDITKLTKDEFYYDDSQYKDAANGEKSEYYYQNRKYLYAWKETKETGQYIYHYDPKNPKTVPISCKIVCEEGVAVEYGPPIASKAGLCFEYKVRVTSTVRCNMTEAVEPPSKIVNVCTPAPTCTGIGKSGSRYYVRQGGPNEDYDKCIKSCDGGKYTKKCSSKCYNKVYGSTSKTSNNNINYSTTKLTNLKDEDADLWKTDPLKHCENVNGGGCYYRDGSTIKWSGSGAGRWYSEGSGRYPGSEYGVFGNGFYRHVYGEGNYCHDTCWWQIESCEAQNSEGNYYLNPNIGNNEGKIANNTNTDYAKNKEEYKRLTALCKAAASCSKTTAEFTISVDYTDGNNKVKRINFPYEKISDISKQGKSYTIDSVSQKDKVSSNGLESGKVDTSTNKNTTIIGEKLGCYNSNSEEKRKYQVAWSFPGSWINNKTGEVSYVNKTGNGSWRTLPNKFCIPLDAQNVNQTWWNIYYGKNLTNKEETSVKDETQSAVCKGISSEKSVYKYKYGETLDENEQKNIVYNISGKTKDFGYFGWNINVSCFYALNTITPVTYEDSKKESINIPEECKASSESRIRTVDLTNLFPSTDGSAKSSDASATGRTPGFNWSTYATINESKNSGYTSYPAQYLAEVQKIGYNVYSDKYLDYEFQLDKSKLAELKKKTSALNDNKKYTSFNSSNGKAFRIGEKSGVSRYTSDIITQYATKVSRKGRVNSGESLDCNNVVNYDSDQCQKVGESS